MATSKDFAAASATPLILSILSHGDSYGYEIIQRVRDVSDGELEWAEGMLYPILHRLEKKGHIESYSQKSESGRRRKYYRICQSGKKELVDLRASWRMLFQIIQRLEKGTACLI